jgi:trimethylamine:corrinoid methyltransferase-like protein
MTWFRKGEIRLSPLWDKRTGEKARHEGVRPLQDLAKDQVKKILKEHQPTPLDPDVERQLAQVVKESEKTLLRHS